MTFWVLIILIALMIVLFLTYTLLRGQHGGEPPAAYDLRVYREQLNSVDRDLARGVIGEADAERVRTEISRRILAADAQMRGDQSDTGPSNFVSAGMIAVLGIILVGGGYGLYQHLGAPGYQDLPLSFRIELADEIRAERPRQSEVEDHSSPTTAPELEESYKNLLNQLRETVAGRPDDLQGHRLLAQHEANAGNYKAAYDAQQRVVELTGESASADEYTDLAEMMILSAQGYVSPEAEVALQQALKRDPSHGPARYYWGQMLAQTGRPDAAYKVWVDTLRDAPNGAPWATAIQGQIEDLAYRAGVFNAPAMAPASPGPSQDDIAAAGEMSAEDRQEMIRGMVKQLSDRLATEGGSAEEWARLIAALGVLGDTDRAIAIRTEAELVFTGNDDALQIIAAAARQAGITQ
ncbi:MAG: c-type cytochrome biogenesis protein CcmI [Ruegeria sp.]